MASEGRPEKVASEEPAEARHCCLGGGAPARYGLFDDNMGFLQLFDGIFLS